MSWSGAKTKEAQTMKGKRFTTEEKIRILRGFNTRRPHSKLRYQSPVGFAAQLTPSLAPVGLRPPSAKDGQPTTDIPTSLLPDQLWPWSKKVSPVRSFAFHPSATMELFCPRRRRAGLFHPS